MMPDEIPAHLGILIALVLIFLCLRPLIPVLFRKDFWFADDEASERFGEVDQQLPDRPRR